MSNSITLPLGGVAIAGRSGSGKSSQLFGSKYVTRVLISDPGSMGHRLYTKHGPESIVTLDTSPQSHSPIRQAIDLLTRWSKEGHLWAFDSFSTIQELQCAWLKRVKQKAMSLPMHGEVVGDLRDLAIVIATLPGFTLFNTSPGGQGKDPEGNPIYYPKGALTGYPALSGVGANSETILARWSTVWCVFAGFISTKPDGESIPRGLLVPGFDIRPSEYANYVPLKDPLVCLRRTPKNEGGTDFEKVDCIPDITSGLCGVDVILERIAERFPNARRAAPASPPPPPAHVGNNGTAVPATRPATSPPPATTAAPPAASTTPPPKAEPGDESEATAEMLERINGLASAYAAEAKIDSGEYKKKVSEESGWAVGKIITAGMVKGIMKAINKDMAALAACVKAGDSTPENGDQLKNRLDDEQTSLNRKRIGKPGELVSNIAQRASDAGWGWDVRDYDGPKIATVMEWVAEFKEKMATPKK